MTSFPVAVRVPVRHSALSPDPARSAAGRDPAPGPSRPISSPTAITVLPGTAASSAPSPRRSARPRYYDRRPSRIAPFRSRPRPPAFLIAVLLLGCASLLRAADDRIPVPPLTGHVVDLTGTLSPQAQRDLEAQLSAFEERKGSQVAVLIVPTTKPEAIEQYSIRVAEQWKLGRKKVDDGAILLVAKDDRTLRIEVGYGLEGALTDLMSKRIVSDIIAPHFRGGDFDGGIRAGVDAMLKVIDGEPLPAPDRSARRAPGGGFSPGFLFAALFFAFAFARGLSAVFGPMRGGLVSGGLAGGLAFVVLKSLAFASGIGFLAFLLTAIFGSGAGRGGTAGRRRGPWDGFGGWGGGGWGGGGWRSGGGNWGSGGGFSGGGGGFGGGGASGRW